MGAAPGIRKFAKLEDVRDVPLLDVDAFWVRLANGTLDWVETASFMAADKWRHGNGAPPNNLGTDGDMYLDDSNGFVYQRGTTVYTHVATIIGPQGVQGDQGIQGNQGVRGSRISINTSPPLEDNREGDMWINIAPYPAEIRQYSGGSWGDPLAYLSNSFQWGHGDPTSLGFLAFNLGDTYIDQDTGDLYAATAMGLDTTWVLLINLMGPQGAKGDTGDPVAAGLAVVAPAPSKIPLADGAGHIDVGWIANAALPIAKLAVDIATQAELDAEATTRGNADSALQANIDAVAAGLRFKEAVRVAVSTNVNVANPGTSTFDGIVLANGESLLLYGQAAGAQNGVYVFNGAASALTRRSDSDTSAEVKSSTTYPVSEGSNADHLAILVTDGAINLGVTSLTFGVIQQATDIVGGAGMTRTGVTLNIGAGAGIQVNADTIEIAAGGVTAAMIAAAAGIPYSKLNLAASIVSGDIVDGTITAADLAAAVVDRLRVAKPAIYTADVDIVSSAAETDLLNGATGYPVLAGLLGTTGMARLSLIGDYFNNTGGNTTITFKVYLGAVLLYTGTTTTIAAAATRRGLDIDLEVANKGATNRQIGSLKIAIGAANETLANPAANVNASFDSGAGAGADTTAQQALRLTATLSSNNALHEMRIWHAIVEPLL